MSLTGRMEEVGGTRKAPTMVLQLRRDRRWGGRGRRLGGCCGRGLRLGLRGGRGVRVGGGNGGGVRDVGFGCWVRRLGLGGGYLDCHQGGGEEQRHQG